MSGFGAVLDQRLIGLALAVGIGLLVGFEREWAEDKPVGLRSFALIGALGGVTALLAGETTVWLVPAGLLGLALVLAAQMMCRKGEGMTTLVAALVVFLIGAAAVFGHWLRAIVLGGVVTLLLHYKAPMHGWVDRLGGKDVDIIARFLLIVAVILPVMPDRTYGPYDVFNPFETWMLVVLIVTLNLAGYVAFRVVGSNAGAWLAGILGGLISSTATTISYASMSRGRRHLGATAALIILVASTVVYARVIIELSVVAPSLLRHIVLPLIAFSAVLTGLSLYLHFHSAHQRDGEIDMAKQENPARIRLALTFAALYAGILFAVAAARDLLGNDAIYAIAILSGLTDVDALTLTLGQSFARGEIEADMAWRAIFLASLANLLFKVGVAGVIGSGQLRRFMFGTGGAALSTGTAMLFLWP